MTFSAYELCILSIALTIKPAQIAIAKVIVQGSDVVSTFDLIQLPKCTMRSVSYKLNACSITHSIKPTVTTL
jgi:hypothetical protein